MKKGSAKGEKASFYPWVECYPWLRMTGRVGRGIQELARVASYDVPVGANGDVPQLSRIRRMEDAEFWRPKIQIGGKRMEFLG